MTLLCIVDDQVLGNDDVAAESDTGQNPTLLDAKSLKEAVDASWDVFVTANSAASEDGRSWKISRTTDT
jgi:hypothetical protein